MVLNSSISNTARGSSTGVRAVPLSSLNHISLICRSIEDSTKFYQDVLGSVRVKRPESFRFNGAWLFNYGIGIHLLQSQDSHSLPKKTEINPRDNHISFQCEDVQAVERTLQEMNIRYVKRIVEEAGIYVDQLFIHDPDGYMVEVCNCENLPMEPIMARRLPSDHIQIQKKQLPSQPQSTVAEQILVARAMPAQQGIALNCRCIIYFNGVLNSLATLFRIVGNNILFTLVDYATPNSTPPDFV